MDVSAIALTGLDVAQSRFAKAAAGIASAGDTTASADSVDLSRQAADLLGARNDFSAGVRLLHIADEIQRTTVNLLG